MMLLKKKKKSKIGKEKRRKEEGIGGYNFLCVSLGYLKSRY